MQRLDIREFLAKRERWPVIDVRSPGEFEKGHIVGALNLPLFDNEERAKIGTIYKRQGKEEAISHGLKLVGVKLKSFYGFARKNAPKRKVLIHCWRGGMRSASMANFFEGLGFETAVLSGGYKSYRRFIRETIENYSGELRVLGGYTGSGKTEILGRLRQKGEQIIDLEQLARHKGSAFGNPRRLALPSQETFENLFGESLMRIDPEKPLWLEDESVQIGSVHIPQKFFVKMREARVYRVIVSREQRIQRLAQEYAQTPRENLVESIRKIQKRLGGQRTKACLFAIEKGNYEEAISTVLDYYDKTYEFGISKRDPENITEIPFDWNDSDSSIERLLARD